GHFSSCSSGGREHGRRSFIRSVCSLLPHFSSLLGVSFGALVGMCVTFLRYCFLSSVSPSGAPLLILLSIVSPTPSNHALQRSRRERRGGHRYVPCAGSLICVPKLFHRRRGDVPA